MHLIDQMLAKPKPPIVIMMTAYGSVDAAVEAMKRGAYDFVTKPLNLDKLEILIRRALRSRQTEEEVVELKKQVEKRYGLDKTLAQQYVKYMGNLVQGVLGITFSGNREVRTVIKERMQISIQLGLSAFLFATILGLGLDRETAVRQAKPTAGFSLWTGRKFLE